MKVAIVGAGLAGLSLASLLIKHNIHPSLFEALPYAGGRAATIKKQGVPYDWGQHIMIGAYSKWFNMLKIWGVDRSKFKEVSFEWHMFEHGLHYTLSLYDKICIGIIVGRYMLFPVPGSALSVLQHFKTKGNLIKIFFEPLALAVFCTSLKNISAPRFFGILQAIVLPQARRFYLPGSNLQDIWAKPALAYLKQHNVNIQYATRISDIRSLEEKFDQVVIATDPWNAALLCPGSMPDLTPAAISTLYLDFEKVFTLPFPLIGYTEDFLHWVIQVSPTRLACLVSGKAYTDSVWQTAVIEKIRITLGAPLPVHQFALSVKQAAFSTFPTHISHKVRDKVWLCGDYLHPIFPATLESAVSSAEMVVRELLKRQ